MCGKDKNSLESPPKTFHPKRQSMDFPAKKRLLKPIAIQIPTLTMISLLQTPKHRNEIKKISSMPQLKI